MAVLSTGMLTLADWTKRLDPDGRVPIIAELLSQSNEILEDAVFQEGNLPTGHRVTMRTGLPTIYYRTINQGIPSSKAETATIDEATGILAGYSRIDRDLAELNGNLASFRFSEDIAFLEAMNQSQTYAMFYGDPTVDPRQFTGLSTRYSSLEAGNSPNIMDAGGTANLASIWLVTWDPEAAFCIFPKGSKAGLTHEDHGELTIYDGNGNPYQAYQAYYSWANGLCVKDWRYVVRIANIDVTKLEIGPVNYSQTASSIDLIPLMSRAIDRLPNPSYGRQAFYMNRTIHSWLRIQAMRHSLPMLTIENALDQFGRAAKWTTFMGVPLRRVDRLSINETRVT